MNETSTSFIGIGASAGIAIGRVFLLDRRQIRVPRFHIVRGQELFEIERLDKAIELSVEQINDIRNPILDQELADNAILAAHQMMLQDKALRDESHRLIREHRLNAEWAVQRVINRFRAALEDNNNPYVKERRSDVGYVGERILRNLTAKPSDINELQDMEAGTIVVAHDLSPADTTLLGHQRVTGFATEVGSKTSHTSIIARSLDVPAVVGCSNIFGEAGVGDMIIVDGLTGTVTLRPTQEELKTARARQASFETLYSDLLSGHKLPAQTTDGYSVSIYGNIELPNEANSVLQHGGEGIGLYRTEFLYLQTDSAPSAERHYRNYCHIIEDLGDCPITIRTMDIGADKNFGTPPADPEANPALGLRGIRYSMHYQEMFNEQLNGLLRAAVHGNIKMLIPMIATVEELRAAKNVIQEVAQDLEKRGIPYSSKIPVGCMIEVPSAVMTVEAIAREVDFLSIGTNDLIQYLLAIDRTNERVAYLYQPLHPAVLKTIKLVCEQARDLGVPVSLCGEMAGEAICTPILLGLGISELSMNSGSIPWVKHLIRELNQSDCVDLAYDAMKCGTEKEIEDLVHEFLQAAIPNDYDLWFSEKT